MFMLHVFGAMGAGDVKLFAAIGSVIGAQLVLPTFVVVVLTGGLLALVSVLRSGVFRTTMHRVLQILVGLLPGWQMPKFSVPADRRLHHSLRCGDHHRRHYRNRDLSRLTAVNNQALTWQNGELIPMRNKRFFIVLVGALIFGVLAAVSVSKYLSSAQAYTKNLNKVAVAKVAIPIGSKIIPEQIMVVQFPKESTPDGAFESPEKLAGRVAVMNIAAREPITESTLGAGRNSRPVFPRSFLKAIAR